MDSNPQKTFNERKDNSEVNSQNYSSSGSNSLNNLVGGIKSHIFSLKGKDYFNNRTDELKIRYKAIKSVSGSGNEGSFIQLSNIACEAVTFTLKVIFGNKLLGYYIVNDGD